MAVRRLQTWSIKQAQEGSSGSFFLFFPRNINWEYSAELDHLGNSNEYPKYMLQWINLWKLSLSHLVTHLCLGTCQYYLRIVHLSNTLLTLAWNWKSHWLSHTILIQKCFLTNEACHKKTCFKMCSQERFRSTCAPMHSDKIFCSNGCYGPYI